MSGRTALPMYAQRAPGKVQFVLNYDQVRLRVGFVLGDQRPDRIPAPVHEGLGLGQQHRLIPYHRPRRERPALPVSHFHPEIVRHAVYGKKAQVMRRRLVFDTRIAETDDEFHAAIPCGDSRPGCPAGQGPAVLTTGLFFLLLLTLLRLLLFLHLLLLAIFPLRLALLLTLLDDLRLSRHSTGLSR